MTGLSIESSEAFPEEFCANIVTIYKFVDPYRMLWVLRQTCKYAKLPLQLALKFLVEDLSVEGRHALSRTVLQQGPSGLVARSGHSAA